MPYAAMKPCKKKGCPGLTREQYCAKHQGEKPEYFATLRAMDVNKTRPSAKERGYGARWSKYSKWRLLEFPLCAEHERLGQLVSATCTDHIIDHRGNADVFWDPANHQSLCLACNTRKAARAGAVRGAERKGKV